MGVENILKREHEIIEYIFNCFKDVNNINILAPQHESRLGVICFFIDNLHFNLGVKILNDRFGIQTRGGCSCAGTYGHYLLHVDEEKSHYLTNKITEGDLIQKPGWIRMSIHPTTTNAEIEYVCQSIKELAQNHEEWAKEYTYNRTNNEFAHNNSQPVVQGMVENWFKL